MEKTDTVVLENLHLRTVNAKLVEALEDIIDGFDTNGMLTRVLSNDRASIDKAREAIAKAKED